MIDHLLSYPTRADALAAPELAEWIGYGRDGTPDFNRSVVFPDLTLWTAQGPFPGYWLVISSDGEQPDAALTAIEPCRMCAHREWAAEGRPFVFQQGLRAAPEQIAQIIRIDGLPAGSDYPLQNLQVIA